MAGDRPLDLLKQMVLPRRFLEHVDRIEDRRRYRKLWWNSTLLTLFVALLPLIVMTGINHYMYNKTVKNELRFDITRNLFSISRSIEFVIAERHSALSLIMKERTLSELTDHKQLGITLQHLKESFGGFVDLGIIDQNGVQVAYVGPYKLEGINYSDQKSFFESVVRGFYVSEVFTGHRKVPHFVISVKYEVDAHEYYVIRATVDMESLNRMIYIPNMVGQMIFSL